MVKTKKLNVHTPLVVTGYILFALLLAGTLLTTVIPWTRLLFSHPPHVSGGNIAVLFVALAVGSLLPVLLGYFIGDKSVRTKSKLSHHFNGVLFGLLAFWIMTLFAIIVVLPPELFQNWPNGRVVLANIVPSFIVAIIVTSIAIAHVRGRQRNGDIVAYKPFSALLIACVVGMLLWLLINNLAMGSVDADSFLLIISLVILGIVSWGMLWKVKLSSYDKLAWSAVSVSIFFVASAMLSQVVGFVTDSFLSRPGIDTYTLMRWGSLIVALVVWSVYWALQVRRLPKK